MRRLLISAAIPALVAGVFALPAATASAAPMPATTAPAQAITVLGGLDLARYCRSIGWSGVVLVSNDAFGFRCNDGPEQAGINMAAACAFQYNNPAAIATYRDVHSPWSWYCFLNTG
jgi:hypothetical protein